VSTIEGMSVNIEIGYSPNTWQSTWRALPGELSKTLFRKYDDEAAEIKLTRARNDDKVAEIKLTRARNAMIEDAKSSGKRKENGTNVRRLTAEEEDEDDRVPLLEGEDSEDPEERMDEELEAKVQFEWGCHQGTTGTNIGSLGQATNFSSYTLNFDTMEQRSNDTQFMRKFRVVHMLIPLPPLTTSDEDAAGAHRQMLDEMTAELEHAGGSFFVS
jgi:hypothetical protein